jgi:hypothetical protein
VRAGEEAHGLGIIQTDVAGEAVFQLRGLIVRGLELMRMCCRPAYNSWLGLSDQGTVWLVNVRLCAGRGLCFSCCVQFPPLLPLAPQKAPCLHDLCTRDPPGAQVQHPVLQQCCEKKEPSKKNKFRRRNQDRLAILLLLRNTKAPNSLTPLFKTRLFSGPSANTRY